MRAPGDVASPVRSTALRCANSKLNLLIMAGLIVELSVPLNLLSLMNAEPRAVRSERSSLLNASLTLRVLVKAYRSITAWLVVRLRSNRPDSSVSWSLVGKKPLWSVRPCRGPGCWVALLI